MMAVSNAAECAAKSMSRVHENPVELAIRIDDEAIQTHGY